MGLEFFMIFTLNLALLGWCYADSEELSIPITRFLGLALLAMPMIGVAYKSRVERLTRGLLSGRRRADRAETASVT